MRCKITPIISLAWLGNPHLEKSFLLDADSRQLVTFRDQLRALLRNAALDEKASGEVLLAVQEALTNVLRHAYENSSGKIEVAFLEDNEKIKISICDFGKKFDLTKVPDPVLPRDKPGGLGVYLIKKLMDQVDYDTSFQEGNLLHLIKFKNRTHK